jgi:hypothetical protein
MKSFLKISKALLPCEQNQTNKIDYSPTLVTGCVEANDLQICCYHDPYHTWRPSHSVCCNTVSSMPACLPSNLPQALV